MQPVRVGRPDWKWRALCQSITISIIQRVVSPLGIMLLKRLEFCPLHSFHLYFRVLCCHWCCRECTILSFLNLVCFLQSSWAFCTVYPDVLCNAVEAISPSLFFLSHFVNPIIIKQLLEKITYKHRIEQTNQDGLHFFFNQVIYNVFLNHLAEKFTTLMFIF